jgi:hypothetical protein
VKIFQRGTCKKTNLISSVGLRTNPNAYSLAAGVHEPEGLFDAKVGLEVLQNITVMLVFHGMI